MEVYTFIMEYLGGTYISQVNANDGSIAMRIWINNLLVPEIEGFTEKDKQRIIENDFVDEEAILIDGLKNTWHFLVKTKKGVGHVNFVKTKV
jgi:hypothetical protein